MRALSQIVRKTALFILVISTLLTPVARAQDASRLETAVMDFYGKLNSGDPLFASYFLEGSDLFPRTGSLLEPSNTDLSVAGANFNAGLDFDVMVRYLEAKVYGTSGVATYYTTGTTTYEDGTLLQGIFRASILAVREGNQWRWAHLHISQLQGQPDD